MSFFGASAKQPTTSKPNYTGLQIQTAVNTLPIPIVYGQNRIAPNLIDYDDFASKADKSQQGGKGGGSPSSTAQTYSATVMMGLCEGPIQSVGLVWASSASTTSYQDLGFSLFLGGSGQTSWGYMLSAHPDKALAYSGTAYLAAANYQLGSAPALPNHNMEVHGILGGSSSVAGNGDADMALVIQDFLTNAQYGAGFPASAIDTASLLSASYRAGSGVIGANDASYQSYCRALGLFMSPALSSQETASSILQRWLRLTNTAAVWSGAALKFIPYGDETVSGNGATFIPDVTPVYDLDDDDFIAAAGEDPIQIMRSDLADANNCARVEIADRTTAYNLVPIEAKDQNAIELYGLRVDSTLTAHEICDPNTGAIAAQLILQRNIHIRNTYTFKLSWEYCLLEPMDLVTLTDPALGLDHAAVRITAIEEDEQGLLTLTAEEFPAGIATATLYPKQSRSPYTLNYNAPADPVNPPVIFEPSAALTGNGPAEIWIGASGGEGDAADPYWGGCDVWISLDDTTYQQIGTIEAPARQGVLTAALPAVMGLDQTSTLTVDLGLSGGVLSSGTTADAGAGRTLIWVDGEIIAYASAVLTSAHHYNLSYLERGLYGTAANVHAAGAAFLRLDSAVFKYDLPAAYVGVPIWLKLPSFNIWGGGRQSLAEAHAYGLTPAGTGYYIAPPANALISSTARTAGDGTHLLSVVISWAASTGPLLDSYEVQWQVQGAASWNSIIVGSNVTDYVVTPAEENITYEARIRSISTYGNLSVWDIAAAENSGELSTSVPAAPNGFTGAGGTRNIALRWNANAEPDIDGYRIYAVHGSATDLADAALIGVTQSTGFDFVNLAYADTWSFWLEAYNVAGASNPAGPLTFSTDFNIPITALQTAALEESYLAADLSGRIDLIDAGIATPGSVNNRISSETTQRQAADNSLAQQLTEIVASLDDAHGAALAAVMQDIVSQVTSTTALARSVIQLVSAIAGKSVTVEQAIETQDGIFGLWSVKIANNGLMSGFGLYSGPQNDGASQSQFVIEADSVLFLPPPPSGTDYATFTTAQLQAAAAKVLVYDATAGQLIVNSALINQVSANALTSGSISSADIEVHPPADGSGGLKIYDSGGNLVLDPTHGIYPGATSVQISLFTASLGINTGLQSLLNETVTFSGRLVMVYISAKSDYATTGGNDINMAIEVTLDSGEVYGNNALPTGVTNLLPIMIQPSAGTHALNIQIGTRTGSTTARNIQVAVIDWKA